MGRPRKSEKRDRQLNISLTRGEYDAVGKRAHALGMQPVDYGRWIMLGQPRASNHPVPMESRFDRLVHIQLRRLGNLLNQTVRHLHQTGVLLPEIEPLLRDIRALMKRSLP